MGNGERGIGNREQVMGKGEQGMGNGEWGTGWYHYLPGSNTQQKNSLKKGRRKMHSTRLTVSNKDCVFTCVLVTQTRSRIRGDCISGGQSGAFLASTWHLKGRRVT